jgi:nickel superoxide dismutase
MKKHLLTIITMAVSLLFYLNSAQAHCEIPCGIYDDATRMTLILEHTTTIEKSMNKINELADGKNPNQLIRWISNKEKHANELQHIVTQYFMTQRIKLDAPDYDKKIMALHKMLVFSMKCKQTTDIVNVEKLRGAAEEFHKLYFTH